MIAADTSFLLDYLDGEDAAAQYLAIHEDEPFFAPSLSLFETYRGAARVGGADGVERAKTALEWVEPLVLDEPASREAACIEAELLEAGAPINLGDTLIAGICRHHGATVLTRDGDFERVDGLDVDRY